MVVAQLVERSLPKSEVHGSNPVFGNIYIEHFINDNSSIENTKIKKKEAGNGLFKKQGM